MASGVRDEMIEGAMRLLARKGLQATSFASVLEETSAPRGSIYHHFPGGKDQLVAAAMDLAGSRLMDALQKKAGLPAVEIATYFFEIWKNILVRSDFEAGCALLAVTVAADSPELLANASKIFRVWSEQLGELLIEGGLTAAQAQYVATLLLASTEGAVVLSRAAGSSEPLDTVSEQMLRMIKTMVEEP